MKFSSKKRIYRKNKNTIKKKKYKRTLRRKRTIKKRKRRYNRKHNIKKTQVGGTIEIINDKDCSIANKKPFYDLIGKIYIGVKNISPYYTEGYAIPKIKEYLIYDEGFDLTEIKNQRHGWYLNQSETGSFRTEEEQSTIKAALDPERNCILRLHNSAKKILGEGNFGEVYEILVHDFNRSKGEDFLTDKPEGAFIIRNSSKNEKYTLHIKIPNGGFHNILISRNESDEFYIKNTPPISGSEELFDTLRLLIDHYLVAGITPEVSPSTIVELTKNYTYVMKVLKDKGTAANLEHMELDLIYEAYTMGKLLGKSNIAQILGIRTFFRPVAIFMDKYEGSLYSILNSDKTITNEHKLKILKDIANGMKHVANEKIIHRDLRSDNILLNQEEDESWTAYVGDFGKARHVVSKDKIYKDYEVKYDQDYEDRVKYPVCFNPPEMFGKKNHYLTKIIHDSSKTAQSLFDEVLNSQDNTYLTVGPRGYRLNKSDVYMYGLLFYEIISDKIREELNNKVVEIDLFARIKGYYKHVGANSIPSDEDIRKLVRQAKISEFDRETVFEKITNDYQETYKNVTPLNYDDTDEAGVSYVSNTSGISHKIPLYTPLTDKSLTGTDVTDVPPLKYFEKLLTIEEKKDSISNLDQKIQSFKRFIDANCLCTLSQRITFEEINTFIQKQK
jgi:serine/threonine protein kinase